MSTIRISAAIAACVALLAVSMYSQDLPGSSGDSTFAVAVIPSAGLGTMLHSGAAAGKEADWLLPGCAMLWKPNRRLNIGVEAAYMKLERVSKTVVSDVYGTTEMNASLNAAAFILLFDMEVWKLNISGGMGASLVQSSVTAYESTVDASSWMAAYYGSATYYLPLSGRFALGIKAGVYSIPKIDKITGGISLAISYDILQW